MARCRFERWPGLRAKQNNLRFFIRKFVFFTTFANEMKILVTGASGFIGSFIVEEALQRGMEVWAAVRKSSSREWLQDSRINFIELDFRSQQRLEEQLRDHVFDYVVHAAGVTKCLDKQDFFRTNTEGTQHLVRALIALQMPLKRFVYLSSLSIFGAIREQQPYEEIRESDTPQPNTAYGQSKLLAEQFLEQVNASDKLQVRSEKCDYSQGCDGSSNGNLTSHLEASQGNDASSNGNHTSHLSPLTSHLETFPYVILRPTGVYGPREKDYFLMAKSIKAHSDFAVGFRRQDITFVYVKDVVQAVFLALDHGKTGRKYFLSDGCVYQSSTFSNLIRRELGSPWWIRITAPVWLLRVVTFCGEHIGRLTGKISALNNDKYHILKQRNWRCDIQPAIDELGYQPHYQLEQGVKETIAWYKEHGWI